MDGAVAASSLGGAGIWINEQVKINSLSASGERAGVRGFHMNLYLLTHP